MPNFLDRNDEPARVPHSEHQTGDDTRRDAKASNISENLCCYIGIWRYVCEPRRDADFGTSLVSSARENGTEHRQKEHIGG
jgi:hypothetical protein